MEPWQLRAFSKASSVRSISITIFAHNSIKWPICSVVTSDRAIRSVQIVARGRKSRQSYETHILVLVTLERGAHFPRGFLLFLLDNWFAFHTKLYQISNRSHFAGFHTHGVETVLPYQATDQESNTCEFPIFQEYGHCHLHNVFVFYV